MTQPTEGHTAHSYDGELSHLHLLILEMGGLALDQVRCAVNGLVKKDMDSANLVLHREPNIDDLEIKVDHETTKIIAKRSPVANDLRIIIAVSKAVTDLERIGDEAAKIAHITLTLYGNNTNSMPRNTLLRDIHSMGTQALNRLTEALAIFDEFDLDRAIKLVKSNSEWDAEFQSGLRRLTTFILEDARNVGHAINIVLVMKALERIGDHAKNLAEYIIYYLRGVDVRHHKHYSKTEL